MANLVSKTSKIKILIFNLLNIERYKLEGELDKLGLLFQVSMGTI
jgi:hypothetical protein